MSPEMLTAWLKTAQSKAVGFKANEGRESVGHHSGKKIVKFLEKAEGEFTDDDIAQVRKVVGFIHRHLAQRPASDSMHSRWRYSLMNWGHGPEANSS